MVDKCIGRNRKRSTTIGMDSARPLRLPADEASLDEIQDNEWKLEITPDSFYGEVQADSRTRERMETVLTEINGRQETSLKYARREN